MHTLSTNSLKGSGKFSDDLTISLLRWQDTLVENPLGRMVKCAITTFKELPITGSLGELTSTLFAKGGTSASIIYL